MISYTQNFLINAEKVRKFVEKTQIAPGATVLEIGPGKGIITSFLADAVGEGGSVIAVELDKQLAEALHQKFASTPQVKIVESDILQFDLSTLEKYCVVANIPFNITSQLLEYLFLKNRGPDIAHLILQTQTLFANTKTNVPGLTLKLLLLLPFYEVELVQRFHRTDFSPQPSVDTALFSFVKRSEPLFEHSHYALYQDFVAKISKDRVGAGAWATLFTPVQLKQLARNTRLVLGSGLKAQNKAAIYSAFSVFFEVNKSKHAYVLGAYEKLKHEIKRKNYLDKKGNHHRSKRFYKKPNSSYKSK